MSEILVFLTLDKDSAPDYVLSSVLSCTAVNMLIILQLFLEVKVTTGLNPGQLKVSILSNASEQLDPILGLAGFGLVLQISLMSNNFHNNNNNIDNNNDGNNNNKNSNNNAIMASESISFCRKCDFRTF